MDTQKRAEQTQDAQRQANEVWKQYKVLKATADLMEATEDDPNYDTDTRQALLNQCPRATDPTDELYTATPPKP